MPNHYFKRQTCFGQYLQFISLVMFIVVPNLSAQTAGRGLKAGSELQSFEKMSLLNAYELARDSDPDLAIARFGVDGAVASRDIAQARFFPQVSVFGEWSENKLRYEGPELGQLPSQDYAGERYGLRLITPILDMRSVREYERQSILVDKTEFDLHAAEATLLDTVTTAFLTVLLTEEDVLQFEAELSALESQVLEAAALHERSLLPITQLLETRTRRDAIAASTVEARGQVSIARERLAQLVGGQPRDLSPVGNLIGLMASVGDADAAARLAIKFDPATAAAEEEVSAARKAIAREKGSWWPEIDFVYTAQYSDVGFDNLTSPPRSSETYSITVQYPFFEGGAGAARLRGAWAEFYSAQQRYEAVKRKAAGRAREAWVNLETASERVQAARQAARTAEVNLDASRKAVRAGTARVNDVLLALAQTTRAKRDVSEARFQRALGWLNLELAVGSDPASLAPHLSAALHGR